MSIFVSAANQMAILFVVIGLGFFARKRGMMDDGFDKKLSAVVINICMPALIVASVLTSDSLPSTNTLLQILGWSTVAYLMIIGIALIVGHLIRTDARRRGTLEYLMTFGNVGFIGFPVLHAIFGAQGVLYGAVLNIPSTIFTWSAGVMMLCARDGGDGSDSMLKAQLKQMAKALISPCIISCYVALALVLLHVTDSGFFGSTTSLIGQMTTPGAMLVIGSSLAKLPVKQMLTNVSPYIGSAVRLILVPVAVYFGLGHFISDQLLLDVITMCVAMPAASSGTMMCIDYGGDLKTMTQGTFITTVASMGTIPAVSLLLI
ncbi:AEC family transporter [Slackia heliotrinireducens]|uniref:AEC family transporter n=1 Tax=Slackia heliotrinireducens TaxID=84110 RepID=UPI003315EC81